jgi:hypothetical protein
MTYTYLWCKLAVLIGKICPTASLGKAKLEVRFSPLLAYKASHFSEVVSKL